MRTTFIAILVGLTLMLTGQEAAENVVEIEGAFGIELGQQFDPQSAIAKSELTNGTPMYGFKPDKPYQAFQSYWVLLTPRSHKVYAIWATGSFENAAKAKAERDVLVSLLEKKYGSRQEGNLGLAMHDAQMIKQGHAYIMIKVNDSFTSATLEARYYNNAHEKLAEQETIELKAAARDASGL